MVVQVLVLWRVLTRELILHFLYTDHTLAVGAKPLPDYTHDKPRAMPAAVAIIATLQVSVGGSNEHNPDTTLLMLSRNDCGGYRMPKGRWFLSWRALCSHTRHMPGLRVEALGYRAY